MTIQTQRFGPLDVPDHRLIMFPLGITPFLRCFWYALIERPAQAPFAWLQSIDEPALAFLVVPPRVFFPHYSPRYSPSDLEPLQLAAGDEILTLVILTLDSETRIFTANLLGPIAINCRTQRAVQVALRDSRFTTKHPISPRLRALAPI